MSALRHALPVRHTPRHWRALVIGYALATALLTLLTVLTLLTGRTAAFEPLYELVLPTVLFASPVLVSAASAALGGGLLPALALGAVPSVAWALAVVAGNGLRALLGRATPVADSPLWAIAGTFLLLGVAGAGVGFLLGRLVLLVRRGAAD